MEFLYILNIPLFQFCSLKIYNTTGDYYNMIHYKKKEQKTNGSCVLEKLKFIRAYLIWLRLMATTMSDALIYGMIVLFPPRSHSCMYSKYLVT